MPFMFENRMYSYYSLFSVIFSKKTLKINHPTDRPFLQICSAIEQVGFFCFCFFWPDRHLESFIVFFDKGALFDNELYH